MKLTAEQIQIVEDTLNLIGLDYDDIKLEVLDHIASEVENKMSLENRSFEETLKAVLENWKVLLKPKTYTFLLGNTIGPRIIMDKMANSIKIELLTAALFVFLLTTIFVGVTMITSNESILFYTENPLTNFFLISSVFLIGLKIYLTTSKVKTTYQFRFNKGFFAILAFSFSRGLGGFPDLTKHNIQEGIFRYIFTVAFGILLLFMVANSLRLAYQHFQFEKKYAI